MVVSEVSLVIHAAVLLAKMVDLAVLVAQVKERQVLFLWVEQEIHLQ